MIVGLAGGGAYAIVLGSNVVTPLPFAVDLLFVRRWRPRPGWWRWPDWTLYGPALRFGLQQSGSGLLGGTRGALESVVLPGVVGFVSMGLLDRARALFVATIGRAGQVLVETAYPLLPRYAGDPKLYARHAAQFWQLLMLVLLPGALYLDTNQLESPRDWNRRSPEALETALRALGITNDTTVIVYGRDTEGDANEKWPGRRAGQIAATRALMILRYAGVDDVRLLDGGYDWWVQGGNPLETVLHTPTPVDSFGVTVPVRPEVIVDIEEAKEIIADPAGAALVSVRTWREHIGDVSGYNYIGPAGRIKGDVWGNCGTDAYHMQHYRNIDNTMRAYPEIAANWDEAGITPDKWVAFYCGTGWRASETWFYAYLQGWQRIAVYDGGWFEWSQDPINNPTEIGLPEAVGTEDAA
jgi:3-mercaptopyruvate sulfurtransferase SseA